MQWMFFICSSGYVMISFNDGYQDRTMFECVDSRPEYIHGQQADTQGGLLHFVTVDCEGQGTTGHCPPYKANRAVTCAVCTKSTLMRWLINLLLWILWLLLVVLKFKIRQMQQYGCKKMKHVGCHIFQILLI